MARIGSPFIITGRLGEIDSYVDGGHPPEAAAYGKMAGSLAIVPR